MAETDPQRPPEPIADRTKADLSTYPGLPRWVKVFGIIVIIVVLLVAIIHITGRRGEPGPGRHIRSGSVIETPSGDIDRHTLLPEPEGQQL
jgi:hypothetical protein